MIIGITGSIGSGKTTAAGLLRKHGFKIIDADEIGHQILDRNKTAYRTITAYFGSQVLDRHKKIDRKKLGNIVFNDLGKLTVLSSIMHQLIVKEISNKVKNYDGNILIDAPLLLETKTKELVDKIIVVKASHKTILKRLSKVYSKKKIEKILKAQMPLKQKLKYADFVIDNDRNLGHLKYQVNKIVRSLN